MYYHYCFASSFALKFCTQQPQQSVLICSSVTILTSVINIPVNVVLDSKLANIYNITRFPLAFWLSIQQ